MPTIGDTLYVISTEEPTTYMASRNMRFYERLLKYPSPLSGTLYIVRRPIVSDIWGIRYKFMAFLPEELETSEAQTQRLFAKVKARQQLAMGEFQEEGLPQFPSKKPS